MYGRSEIWELTVGIHHSPGLDVWTDLGSTPSTHCAKVSSTRARVSGKAHRLYWNRNFSTGGFASRVLRRGIHTKVRKPCDLENIYWTHFLHFFPNCFSMWSRNFISEQPNGHCNIKESPVASNKEYSMSKHPWLPQQTPSRSVPVYRF